MKLCLIIPILIILSGCTSVNILSECPNGHKNIVDVPILYGFRIITPELNNKIKNLDVVLGGCDGDYGKHIIYCKTCHAYCLENNPYKWYPYNYEVLNPK